MVKDKNISGDCNFLFVISAPSGTGKTTICRYLLEKHNDLVLSISATTREPRKGEIDKKDYFFISKDEFMNRIHVDGFLEYAKVFDNYYVTPMDFIHRNVSNNFNILFDIDWQGMRQIKAINRFNVITLFLVPPSLDELFQRLLNRGDKLEQIERRISGFLNDVEKAHEYDYVIVNDNLEQTCEAVENIYQAEKIKFSRAKVLNFVNEITNSDIKDFIKNK
jgi:guanylate kinase